MLFTKSVPLRLASIFGCSVIAWKYNQYDEFHFRIFFIAVRLTDAFLSFSPKAQKHWKRWLFSIFSISLLTSLSIRLFVKVNSPFLLEHLALRLASMDKISKIYTRVKILLKLRRMEIQREERRDGRKNKRKGRWIGCGRKRKTQKKKKKKKNKSNRVRTIDAFSLVHVCLYHNHVYSFVLLVLVYYCSSGMRKQ